jgi:hypothetical protein
VALLHEDLESEADGFGTLACETEFGEERFGVTTELARGRSIRETCDHRSAGTAWAASSSRLMPDIYTHP